MTGAQLAAAASIVVLSACGGAGQLTDLEADARSIRATALMASGAWLAGQVRGSYARATLLEAGRLVEQQQATLTTSPRLLADARGAALGTADAELARHLAILWTAVGRGDAAAVRRERDALASARGAAP
ncbi:MAG TPA: hypothetical protein VL309_08940 [Vicinamibacterales bacterium]|jgi:hypothetical protein|nr:hypothetical protein [Vicinamibacterales bacterium]